MNIKKLIDFFHKNTSLNRINLLSLQSKISDALMNPDFQKRSIEYSDIYNKISHNTIYLKKSNWDCCTQKTDLLYCLMNRRTNSNLPSIEDSTLSFNKFSKILRFAFGVSKVTCTNHVNKKYYQFTYPTEGGINTIEIYIYINKVENVEKGLYLYDPYKNRIIGLNKNLDQSNITSLTSQAKNSYFTVYFVGNIEISHIKYGDRTYRFINIEAGHCSQNLYLVATSLGLECAASGGFLDDDFFKYIGISETNRYLLYENFIGK